MFHNKVLNVLPRYGLTSDHSLYRGIITMWLPQCVSLLHWCVYYPLIVCIRTAVVNNFTLSSPLYRHLVSSGHDALSPSIPNTDFNQTGAEDLCVPGSANHTMLLMSSQLNAPRLGILEINQTLSSYELESARAARDKKFSFKVATSSNGVPLHYMVSRCGALKWQIFHRTWDICHHHSKPLLRPLILNYH